MFKRAVVVSNKDPNNEGRVKFRYITFSAEQAPEDSLHWAYPLNPFPGAEDSGSFMVPPEGTIVAIFLEDTDVHRPFYLGGWNTVSSRPKEAVNLKRRVIYKSELGATIYIDDSQGGEQIRIIDRLGQVIEMASPATSETPTRGENNVLDGSALTTANAPNKTASISITGLNGAVLEIVSENDKSSINIVSAEEINIISNKVKINDGKFGVHTAGNHPYCFYTGQPLNGDPNFLSP